MIEILPPRKRIRENPGSREGVFEDDPFEVTWLDHLNLDVELDADDLVTRGFEARGLKSQIQATDGKLEISARAQGISRAERLIWISNWILASRRMLLILHSTWTGLS